MHNDHDTLFRHVFAQPEHAASLLRTILPPALANAIDWSSLRLVAGSSVDEELKSRQSDLLFEALIGGQPVLLYVVLEHKTWADRWTALQMLRYIVRIFDRWRLDHPDAKTLPPAVPIVVHHGDRAWNR
ncbi:MAG: Rpn family recombination-promoting nuclease/putative transposase, partial [Planctomycetota bacterium]